jgi:hypothetical protein
LYNKASENQSFVQFAAKEQWPRIKVRDEADLYRRNYC